MSRFRIVPEESQVWIEGRSSVHPIHSHTDGLEGWIEAKLTNSGHPDLRSAVSAHVSFPVNRLRSSNPLEERELRRRINARSFPTIEGALTAIKGDPGAANRYLVTGDVTFRGVTRPHSDVMEIALADGRLTLLGRSRFDIREFGMDPPRILMLSVDPVVEVTIQVVADQTAS